MDVKFWIAELNKLVKSTVIYKYTYGPQVAFISVNGMPASVSVTEIGFVDFTKVQA